MYNPTIKQKNRLGLFLILLFISLFFSCSQFFLTPEPASDIHSVVNVFWQEFDKLYPYFDLRATNWDSLHYEKENWINFFMDYHKNQENGEELAIYSVLSKLIYQLQDGHVRITTPFGSKSFPILIYGDSLYLSIAFNYNLLCQQYFINHTIHATNYLPSFNKYVNYALITGELPDSIGYLRLGTFRQVYFQSVSLDNLFTQLRHFKGLIIDVRDNSGGLVSIMKGIASRFTTKKIHYGYKTYRNGPRHDDFSELQHLYLEPSPTPFIDCPVVILTNNFTISSAEIFTLCMQLMDQVTIVGDTTRGISGTLFFRELPNGWQYTMALNRVKDLAFQDIEARGVVPDILVTPEEEFDRNRDLVVETAIKILNTKTSNRKKNRGQ